MIATARLHADDLQILRDAKRDRVAAARPAQLEERRQLVAALTVDPDAVKRERAYAAEAAAAEQAVEKARVALQHAQERVSTLWREHHGRGHRSNLVADDARARLRALAHPSVGYIVRGLINAHLAACAIRPTVVGIENIEEEIAPSAEVARQWWLPPATHRTSHPVSTHGPQVAFMNALSAARGHVEDLQYSPLDDDTIVSRLRAELDALVALNLPLSLAHVQGDLTALRRKLDGAALDVWSTVTEDQR